MNAMSSCCRDRFFKESFSAAAPKEKKLAASLSKFALAVVKSFGVGRLEMRDSRNFGSGSSSENIDSCPW